MDLFHIFVIPFLVGLALMLLKHSVSGTPISFDEANDIALDMVVLSVGAIVALYIQTGNAAAPTSAAGFKSALQSAQKVYSAGAVDAFLAAVLFYIRSRRQAAQRALPAGSSLPPVGWKSGLSQLSVGAFAVIWTVLAV